MTELELYDIIDKLSIGEKVTIKSSTMYFGLLVTSALGETVVILGGFGNHYSIWSFNTYEIEEMIEGISKHIGGYLSDVTEWITLDECEVVTD